MSPRLRLCYALSASVFLILFILFTALFYNVTNSAASILLMISYIPVLALYCLLMLMAATFFPGQVMSAELGYRAKGKFMRYAQRFLITTFLVFVFGGLAASLCGGLLINAVLGWARVAVTNSFLSGFIAKGPIFIVFLYFEYRVFLSFGHSDTRDKDFNPHLTLLSLLQSLAFILPATIKDHMFETNFKTNTESWPNLQTVFSQGQDLLLANEANPGTFTPNADFSLIWVIVSVLAVSLAQLAWCAFAYKRGRDLFFQEHPHDLDYDTQPDEPEKK